MAELNYTPPLSVAGFLTSDAFSSLIVGPVGSTKTTSGLVKIAYEAQKVAACKDGIRRSRCAVIRNTNQMLTDSTIPDFLKFFPEGDFGLYMRTEKRFILKFGDVECEVMFRGLDDANDVRRLLSLQLSFGVMDEFREIHQDIYEALQGRLGRYPDGVLVPHRPEWGVDSKGNPIKGCVTDDGKPAKKVWGMTNPPDIDSYWEKLLTNPPSNTAVFIQPSGLSPEADWIEHLPSDYYENLAEGKSEDWIDVYIHAKFGKSLAGKPVFRSFNREMHVSKVALTPVLGSSGPIIVGFDCTGLGPAAVIGQLGYGGRLYIYDAIYADEMGPLRFVREKLKPLLTSKYAGGRVAIIVDPAGMARNGDEKTIVEILKGEGLVAKPASTNAIAARVSAVEQYLTRTIDGKSGIVIDPACVELIQAFNGKYRYKIKKDGTTEDTPQKLRPWADLMDSLQYLCLRADNGSIFGADYNEGPRKIIKSPKRWAV